MTAHDILPGAVPDPMVHRRETRHVVRRRLDVHREPLTPCFGLRITGVDLTALDAGQERAIIMSRHLHHHDSSVCAARVRIALAQMGAAGADTARDHR